MMICLVERNTLLPFSRKRPTTQTLGLYGDTIKALANESQLAGGHIILLNRFLDGDNCRRVCGERE